MLPDQPYNILYRFCFGRKPFFAGHWNRPPPPANQIHSKLQYFDLSCKLKNEVPFEVVRGSDESDTSQAGGMLVLVDNEVGTLVYREPLHQMVATLPGRHLPVSPRAGDFGKMVCLGRRPNADDGSMRCYTLGEPESKARTYEINRGGSAPFVASSKSSLVVFPERRYWYNALSEESHQPLRRYVIWDGLSGMVRGYIGAMKQYVRNYEQAPLAPGAGFRWKRVQPFQLEDSCVIAVSDRGDKVAIAGADSIDVFNVVSVAASKGLEASTVK